MLPSPVRRPAIGASCRAAQVLDPPELHELELCSFTKLTPSEGSIDKRSSDETQNSKLPQTYFLIRGTQ